MKRRDWKAARAKVDAEGNKCRVCWYSPAEAAHVIGRAHDERRGNTIVVNPDSIVPLCRDHHARYDAHEFDLLPFLFVEEQAQAVTEASGIVSALRRISGRAVASAAASERDGPVRGEPGVDA